MRAPALGYREGAESECRPGLHLGSSGHSGPPARAGRDGPPVGSASSLGCDMLPSLTNNTDTVRPCCRNNAITPPQPSDSSSACGATTSVRPQELSFSGAKGRDWLVTSLKVIGPEHMGGSGLFAHVLPHLGQGNVRGGLTQISGEVGMQPGKGLRVQQPPRSHATFG